VGDAQMYIDGKWLDAAEGRRVDVKDPATGETFATVPDAQKQDAEAAIDAARRAFDEGPLVALQRARARVDPA
jgi:acyl-CoA reductase-like NAD-dependent aldehyde dehydrogenase